MRTVQRGINILAVIIAFIVLLGLNASAAENSVFWHTIQEQKAYLYISGGEDVSQCQVGNVLCKDITSEKLSEQEHPIKTVILLDNSLSIPKDERPIVTKILESLVGNRMDGEVFTIATFSDDLYYLCEDESDYLKLRSVIEGIAYQNQQTQLSDNIYEAINTLKETNSTQFCRVVVISDGVNNKEIGFTQNELYELIKSCGYPIYTIGCTNSHKDGKTELENFFALSRITTGGSFYLAENNSVEDIVYTIEEYNNATLAIVSLPDEICDGSSKAMKVTCGEENYVVTLTMPFSEVKSPASSSAASSSSVESSPVASEAASSQAASSQAASSSVADASQTQTNDSSFALSMPVIAIAAVAAVALICGIVIFVLYQKKKKETEANKNKQEEKEDTIERIEDFGEDNKIDGFGLWDNNEKEAGKNTETEYYEKKTAVSSAEETEFFGAEEAPASRIIRLVSDSDPTRFHEFPLHRMLRIGRADDCDMHIADRFVARNQCEIYESNGAVFIRNISQTNITKVNGQEVLFEEALSNGDIITIGPINLKVEIL